MSTGTLRRRNSGPRARWADVGPYSVNVGVVNHPRPRVITITMGTMSERPCYALTMPAPDAVRLAGAILAMAAPRHLETLATYLRTAALEAEEG